MVESRKVALILVDHGSRNDASNSALDEMVRLLAGRCGDRCVAVLPAHMDLVAPDIGAAFEAAAAAGAELVVVGLYFLAPGRHSETDVPRLAAAAAARVGVDFVIGSPLGPDELLCELLLARVDAAVVARSRARRAR